MLNRGYAYTTIISSKYHGRTLLSHLASLYPHSTPQAWQQKLNNREVTVNGVTATGSESVFLGQTLVWNRPPWIEPDAPQHFEVLFDDPHLLAVNKPGGLPTLPAAALWKTLSCGWCKSKLRTQTLSTGWAGPLPASSSSPKPRRPPLN
jgi:23S rRNA-/tRNA-specific pseudouridylate synthase